MRTFRIRNCLMTFMTMTIVTFFSLLGYNQCTDNQSVASNKRNARGARCVFLRVFSCPKTGILSDFRGILV